MEEFQSTGDTRVAFYAAIIAAAISESRCFSKSGCNIQRYDEIESTM
jgi:hypothetical protein